MIRKVRVKRMLVICILMLAAICLVGISKAYGATVTGTVTDPDGVNLRTEPDTSKNNIIMAVPYNAKVEILGTAQGSGYSWYQVRYSGKTGYAVSNYITKDTSSGASGEKDFTNTYGIVINSPEGLNVRSGPGTGYSSIDALYNGNEVKVNGQAKDSNGDIWYQITCSAGKGYVFGQYLSLKEVKPYEPNADFEAHLTKQGFPESYKVLLRQLHAQYPNWIFVAGKTNLDWNYVITKEYGYAGYRPNTIQNGQPDSWKTMEDGDYNFSTGEYRSYDSGYYVATSKSMIEYYMDPRNFLNSTDIFQFISSKYVPALQNSTGLQAMINGTFMSGRFPESTYPTYNAVLMEAASQSGASPYTLATMILQEQGYDGSGHSISGTEPGYAGIYNYFNIGAYASGGVSAVENGLIYARNQGWNTRAKSILGGANWFARNYVNANKYTQYLKKFNVMNGAGQVATGQYMTHVMGSYLEGRNLRSAYAGFLETSLTFEIPVYTNMPESACPMPGRYGNNNNFLDSISVSGKSLSPAFDRFTYTYNVDAGDASKVTLSAKANNSAAKVEGLGTKTLKAGTNTFNITVTATSGEKRVYTVNVKTTGPVISSIALTSKPSNLVYEYGDSKINLSGAVLTVTYSDGEKEKVNVTADMVSGYDLKKIGKQTITVKYSGKTTTFEITVKPADISKKNATLEYSSVDCDRTEKKPAVSVDGLRAGTDYTVSYSNNVNPGTATVTITGKGNYTGMIVKTFVINSIPGFEGIFGNSNVARIYGKNRYETAIEAAEVLRAYSDLGTFDHVVVACGTDYPDALSGSFLATSIDAPILLVGSGYEDYVAGYINANLEDGGNVIILGGTGVVSVAFENKINTSNITRLGGRDRYETNINILNYLGVTTGDLLVCTGNNFADSLSASSTGYPILLVGSKLTESQKVFLQNGSFEYDIIGGTGAVSANIETELNSTGLIVQRIAGTNRYETSALLADWAFDDTSGVAVLASGQNFPDGLVGGVLGYFSNSPMILVDNSATLDANIFTEYANISKVMVMGGPGIISDTAVNNVLN